MTILPMKREDHEPPPVTREGWRYHYLGIPTRGSPRPTGHAQQVMRLEGYEFWGQELPGFETFWKFLSGLVESESRCSCRNGQCGPSFCEIRKCACARGVEVCVFCKAYPCPHVHQLAQIYPTPLADGQRMKDVGIENWIKEQEERRRSGFVYADIRCQAPEKPET